MDVKVETGEYLVKLARFAAKKWINEGEKPEPLKPIEEQAKLTTGVFVTVRKIVGDSSDLRGCIGYPLGIGPLYEEVIDLARDSTLNDPRFPPVKTDELDSLIFEVTVLTPPEKINFVSPQELLNQIEIGRDGLIVQYKSNKGLLLPQVPVDQGWDKEEFLSYTCRKAWLKENIWLKEKIIVEKFQGVVFAETSPNGKIEQMKITE